MGSNNEIAIDLTYFRIYKDNRIDRIYGEEVIPTNPVVADENGVRSKDIVVSPQTGLSARIFLPQPPDPTRKLPLIIYFHGGAFCAGTPFSVVYNCHANILAAEAKAVVLSVHYRRAPEFPLPTAYDDALEAINWAAAHDGVSGPEEWINEFVDLERIFLGGDSAGANIAHNAAMRVGLNSPNGPRIVGMFLAHPYFGNDDVDKLLEIIFPTSSGVTDPRVNPCYDPDLGKLGCGRVVIFVAEKDVLRERGLAYYEALIKSGWAGTVEIEETFGEGHVFHLFGPKSDRAVALVKKVASFLNQN